MLACNSSSKLVTDMELGQGRRKKVITQASIGTLSQEGQGEGTGSETQGWCRAHSRKVAPGYKNKHPVLFRKTVVTHEEL